jgi:hypothetical protein
MPVAICASDIWFQTGTAKVTVFFHKTPLVVSVETLQEQSSLDFVPRMMSTLRLA